MQYDRTAQREKTLNDKSLHEFAMIGADWFWETDALHFFTWGSSVAVRKEAIGEDEVRHRILSDLVVSELTPQQWAFIHQCLKERRPFRNVLLCLRLGCTLRWMFLSGRPRFTRRGMFRGYLGCGRELLPTMLPEQDSGFLHNGLALFSQDGELLAWNQHFVQLHRYLGAQLKAGLSLRQWLEVQLELDIRSPVDEEAEVWLERQLERLCKPVEAERYQLDDAAGWRHCQRRQGPNQRMLWLEKPIKLLNASAFSSGATVQIPSTTEPAVLMVDSHNLSIIDANAGAAELYECARMDLDDLNVLDLFAQTDEAISFIGRALAQGSAYVDRLPHRTLQGKMIGVSIHITELECSGGNSFCMIVDGGSRSQEAETLAPLQAEPVVSAQFKPGQNVSVAPAQADDTQLERLQDFTDIAADMAWELDIENRISYVSESFAALAGRSAEALQGQEFSSVLNALVSDPDTLHRFMQWLRVRSTSSLELPLHHPNGTVTIYRMNARPITDSQGEFKGYRGVGQDITDSHQLSQQLIYQATHDELTGLINRREFEHRLAGARERSKTSGIEHVLCYLDLDQFKIVNDTVGHSAGDQLLRQVAGMLASRVRRHDTIARLGGDEFGLLLDGCGLEDACRIAQHMIDDLKSFRFSWQEHRFEIGASIGLVPMTMASSTVSHLLSLADIACYVAKDAGRGRYHIYRPEDRELVRRQSDLRSAASLTQALQENRFILLGQPIQALQQKAEPDREHIEILVRVVDADGHILEPGAFIPAAERFGMMAAIDRWIIATSISHYRSFVDKPDDGIMALNLSGLSLTDPGMIDFIKAELQTARVRPDCVCFEITETAAIRNFTQAQHFVAEMRELGCLFSLDDFGSGLSSFSYLREFSVDYLKIDGSFVRRMTEDPVNKTLVAAINDIGHAMGMKTIAEGAEQQETIELLQSLGVDYVQGYVVAKPRPLYRHPRTSHITL